jgi:hypothetical protein
VTIREEPAGLNVVRKDSAGQRSAGARIDGHLSSVGFQPQPPIDLDHLFAWSQGTEWSVCLGDIADFGRGSSIGFAKD